MLVVPKKNSFLLTLVADICIWGHYCLKRTMPCFMALYQKALLTHC